MVQDDLYGRMSPRRRGLTGDIERRAHLAADVLIRLVRSRRFYLEEFLESDGPYWSSVGMYLDEASGITTTYDRLLEFTDESLETSRYLIRRMIDYGLVETRVLPSGENAFSLTPAFALRMRTFLDAQATIIIDATR